jgi:hypothetical protein
MRDELEMRKQTGHGKGTECARWHSARKEGGADLYMAAQRMWVNKGNGSTWQCGTQKGRTQVKTVIDWWVSSLFLSS